MKIVKMEIILKIIKMMMMIMVVNKNRKRRRMNLKKGRKILNTWMKMTRMLSMKMK